MTTLRRAGALPGVPRACPLGLALLLLALTLAEAARAAEPCVPEIARIVSMQGPVQVQRAGTAVWVDASLDQPLCIGDRVRVGALGRAALAFVDDSVLRLDQRTTLHLRGVGERERTLLDLVLGAVYFFSHRPRALEIGTPFINAGTEGTEFFVRVGDDFTRVIMFEGRVRAVNPQGELLLAAGEAALARAGEAPRPEIVARPRDAVAWALYYPPVFAALAGRGALPRDLPPALRTAALHAAENRYAEALEALDEAPPDARDARYWAFRAGVLLNVGRVEEAEDAIGRALELQPEAGDALAQRAIIEIVRNQPDAALASARRAVEASPDSAAARVALSYALQANLQLDEARETLREAADAFPEDALVWARLAEIELARGYLDRALDAAERAVALAPGLGRTQMVLGFAHLARIDPGEARAAFARAIELEPANPLSRLGQGLARIRQSELAAGRHEIEIAAALDPNQSLIRSYLGKAYFEETREDLAGEQLAIAKELDPNDPTPWFYDAIRKQLENRPVEALRDLETAIALNDNRAIYRSRLLLDEDLATRGVSLARIYDDLGFDQRALVEASKSLSLDPANWSAHRFLSDAYARQPRHEIARASELLQAQLLQPININPVQPGLPVTDLNIVEGLGPAEGAFNEFHPLFLRDQVQLTASGVVGDAEGNEDMFGGEIVASTILDRYSASAGLLHFQTKGFRPNNDLETDVYNLYGQAAVTPKLNLQAELRRRDTDQGDLVLNFDPDVFSPNTRRAITQDTARIGIRYSPVPSSDSVLSLIYSDRKGDQQIVQPGPAPDVIEDSTERGIQAEAQQLFRHRLFNLAAGVGFYDIDVDQSTLLDFSPAECPIPIGCQTDLDFRREQLSLYAYANVLWPERWTWTLGLGYDSYEQRALDLSELNPKFGVQWEITDRIRLRAAYIETVKRALIVSQTIEPTQVAGFNQFFDDVNGTASKRYGIGLDLRLTDTVYAGVELARRELRAPIFEGDDVIREEREEDLARAYVYWAVHPRWTLTGEVQLDWFDGGVSANPTLPREVETISIPLAVRYFDPLGFFAQIGGTYVDQKVERFEGPDGSDDFVVLDAALGYRLPDRHGILSLEGRNLLDERFMYQDDSFRTAEPVGPRYVPGRIVLGRATFSF
jgi:tetratricopeptide (TPR) repeat protein